MVSVRAWQLKTAAMFSLAAATKVVRNLRSKLAENKDQTPRAKDRLSVLTHRRDFLHLLKNGQRLKPSPWLLMNYIESQTGRLRCGWTLPRQVGPAVVRNRLKRWSRVYFRARLKDGHTLPVDLNLVFRKTEGDFYKKLSYERFASVVDKGWLQLQSRLTSRRGDQIRKETVHGKIRSSTD